ncbi:MAG TPA: ATP-binding protein [Candidatus Eremiobacteraceae bacterium]|nr:ATP-binding protein [Candidatus Eremiobacteraceae bacterium]
MRPRTERRDLPSRIPELRGLIPALRDLAQRRRAAPLLYLEITGLDGLRSAARHKALRACKRAVAAALAASAGSVLRRGDAVAAGPNAAWFAALLVGRSIDVAHRPGAPDADLVVAATRLRQAVLAAFRDEAARGKIPAGAGVRAGWTVVEPADAGAALAEFRLAVRGAAVVARIEERRAAFLASVTHELRTPLTAIIGYAERLQAGGRKAPGSLQRDLAIIESEGRRLARLVEGLIDAGAWGAGSLRLRTEPVGIGELTDAGWATVEPRHAVRKVNFLRRGDATVSADRERLQQVLVNVLDNAARHARHSVTATIARRGGKIRIAIEDDGAGFAAEAIRDFARPFAVGPLGHLGLGLSIARLLVEAHGGTLRASPRRNGGGASVIATLPVRDPK